MLIVARSSISTILTFRISFNRRIKAAYYIPSYLADLKARRLIARKITIYIAY